MVTLAFGALSSCALLLAFLTRDWRLKTMAASCFAVWMLTALFVMPLDHSPAWLDPIYTAFLFSTAFGIQARGEAERARGEPLAMWLLVFMGVEALIAVTYLLPREVMSLLTGFYIIQIGYAAELLCLIWVGGRRLRLAERLSWVWTVRDRRPGGFFARLGR